MKRFAILAILAAFGISTSAIAVRAEVRGILQRGDAAVTSFSGISVARNAPKNLNPLDVTLIDREKPTLQIFDLSNVGGKGANELFTAPSKLDIKAADIGHVFGVALDAPASGAPPNVYAAATSLFGLQIVERTKDGNLTRLVEGHASAEWMPGQFGLERGGGPGSIWKIDGVSGAVSLFATITSGNLENAGPGLAGLAYDPLSNSLYAANLETGLIHQIDRNGREVATFDHGVYARTKAGLPIVADDPARRMDIKSPSFNVEDPATWGYADKKRRVLALAVESGRLYYSVADGPVIWSVGLSADGHFADDARLEIDVTGTPDNNPITAIAFDGPGALYLTQRGELAGSYDYSTFARPQTSVVRKYLWDNTKKEWKDELAEFPVGLEPVHRATNGGLALGYGYDSTGKIDFARCRQTLWTTGENLIAGEGRAATVDGLQGLDKTLTQTPQTSPSRSGAVALETDFSKQIDSGLEPPKTAWFADTDGNTEGPVRHAHVGAIAIFAPCDKALAEPKRPEITPYIPWTPKMPGPSPHTYPGIFIDKLCLPSVFGGKVRCEIWLTNIATPPLWPVSFTDVSSILFGPGAGSTIAIDAVVPDGPDFICSPTPSSSLSCWLPALSLPPGTSRKVDVWVDTSPLIGSGNAGFINCASLTPPHNGIACDEGGAEIAVEKKAPAACMPGAPCTFSLTVTNKGSMPFEGEVLLSDQMFVGGAGVAAPITAIAPNIGCNGGDPVALPFNCTVLMSLAPNVPITFNMTVTMPAAAPNYWAQNCFVASNPALPAPPLPGGVGSPASCAWVPVGAPPPLSNLRLEKTAGACAKNGLLNVRCEYALKITNTGPSPFSDTITLSETTSATATLTSLDPSLVCIPGGGGANTCSTPAAVNLNVGQSVTFAVAIDTPKLDIDANLCKAPNTAKITAPLGPDKNFDAADDEATATGDAALIEFFDPITGLTLVLCDPTNLKTTKVSTGACAKSGKGYDCGYTITVENMGPDPYKGPITIKDELAGATSASFTGDWSCAGSASTYLCTKGPIDLAKGASVTLNVKATFPDSGQCVARNRASMTFPLAGTRYNLSGADDTATASSKMPSSKCEEKPQCTPGANEFRSASGACACREGTVRDRKGACVPITRDDGDTETCPDGKPIPRSGICPCVTGKVWNRETKRCEALCEPGPNEYRTSAGQCVCKSGYKRIDGRCRAVEDETPPVIDESCVPGPNEYRTSNGECVCKQGYERVNGSCRPIEIVCKKGTHFENGRCVPDHYETGCEEGAHKDPRTGKCVPNYDPVKDCRDKGWVWTGSKCIPGIVIDPVNPIELCRKKGWIWNGSKCIEPTNPAEECRKKGWTWTGSKCVEPTNPAEECKKKGWVWTGKICVKPEVVEPKKCPDGTVGKWPKCRRIEIQVPDKVIVPPKLQEAPPTLQKQNFKTQGFDVKKLNLGRKADQKIN
jgi:hypothetical protein